MITMLVYHADLVQSFRPLICKLLVESLKDVEHLLQQRRLRQDGGAEVVGARLLAESTARDHADTWHIIKLIMV